MTVIISSHILPEIEMTCDRVLIINQGRVVAQGTPADLRREVLGRSTYELEVAGDTTSLPLLLATIDPTLQVSAAGDPDGDGFRRLTLSTENDGELGESLLRTLSAQSYRLRSLRRTNPTLEDVFLAATRRSWDVKSSDLRKK